LGDASSKERNIRDILFGDTPVADDIRIKTKEDAPVTASCLARSTDGLIGTEKGARGGRLGNNVTVLHRLLHQQAHQPRKSRRMSSLYLLPPPVIETTIYSETESTLRGNVQY
jgi:hypothetical protein